jgi:peptidoglycan hydrolase-like protein with peptidoglycan-binding domain
MTNNNLSFGDHEKAVTFLKLRLKVLGFFDDKEITDCFDDETKEAVKAFQQSQNLVIDGIVGIQTQLKLKELIIAKNETNRIE